MIKLTCGDEVRTVRELTFALSLIAPRSERWIAEQSTTINSRTVLSVQPTRGLNRDFDTKILAHEDGK